jgi:tetratricopeptide (TPR) repeat protein
MTGVRSARAALAAALLAVASACATTTPAVVPNPTAPRYPEFVYPAVPQGVGTPELHERHDIGWRWLQSGDPRAAERTFNAALKLSADFYPAEAGLGYASLAREDPRRAVEHFDRAVVVNPRYAPALVGRGEALLALGDREMALKSLEAALVADPKLASLSSRVEVLRFQFQQEEVARARKLADGGRLAEARKAYESAIASSPQSPFLYRELAAVERRDGNLSAALAHARKASELDPNDARSLVLIGEIHEAQGDFAAAIDAYTTAAAMEPNEALAAKIEALRERAAFAAMPAEYRDIEAAQTVNRAQLAALLGVRLDELVKRTRRNNAVVITDTRGSWAAPWIMAVARAGLMEVYPNHTFLPGALVRRGDLAQAASRALAAIAAQNPKLASTWRDARRKFPDVSPGHLSYPAASLAVEAGVMQTLEGGTFQLTRPVTGADAVAAVRRLEELAGTRR